MKGENCHLRRHCVEVQIGKNAMASQRYPSFPWCNGYAFHRWWLWAWHWWLGPINRSLILSKFGGRRHREWNCARVVATLHCQLSRWEHFYPFFSDLTQISSSLVPAPLLGLGEGTCSKLLSTKKGLGQLIFLHCANLLWEDLWAPALQPVLVS